MAIKRKSLKLCVVGAVARPACGRGLAVMAGLTPLPDRARAVRAARLAARLLVGDLQLLLEAKALLVGEVDGKRGGGAVERRGDATYSPACAGVMNGVVSDVVRTLM